MNSVRLVLAATVLLAGCAGGKPYVPPSLSALPFPERAEGWFEFRVVGGAMAGIRTQASGRAVFAKERGVVPAEILLNRDRLTHDEKGWYLNGERFAPRGGSFLLRGEKDRPTEPVTVFDPELPAYPPRFWPETHGQGTLTVDDGLPTLRLRGSPEEMGEQAGTILKDQIRYLLRHYVTPVLGRSRWEAAKLARKMMRRVPRRYEEELRAVARAASVSYDELLLGNLMVEIYQLNACSALAVRAPLTQAGTLLLGRNLDFPHNNVLHRFTLVIDQQGEEGQRVVSIGWPGMIGVVSGMNESGLCVVNLIAEYEEHSLSGVPYAFLIRMMLESSASVGGALTLLRGARRTTGNSLMIADAQGDAAVAEVTHSAMKVRRLELDRLFATNIFRSEPEYPYPCGRYDRMVELVAAAEDAASLATVEDVQSILDEVDIPWRNIQSMVMVPERREIHLATGHVPAAPGPYRKLVLFRDP